MRLAGQTQSREVFRECTMMHWDWVGFTLDTPICDFSEEAREALLYGTKGEPLDIQVKRFSGGTMSQPFEGIINNLERRYHETNSEYMRAEIEDCMSAIRCQDCGGHRLKKEILAVTVGGMNIAEYCELSVTKALDFMQNLELTEMQHKIGDRVIKEILDRLGFLQAVGLEYLTLSRASGTLSGGESQRIRLATPLVAPSWGYCIFWTSRPLVCISGIMISCSIRSSICAILEIH